MEELPDEMWNRSTVLRIVEHQFVPEEREDVLAALSGRDAAPRIQLAILARAGGDPQLIAGECRGALTDWRDEICEAFIHSRYFVDSARERRWREVFAMLGVPERGWPVMEPFLRPDRGDQGPHAKQD